MDFGATRSVLRKSPKENSVPGARWSGALHAVSTSSAPRYCTIARQWLRTTTTPGKDYGWRPCMAQFVALTCTRGASRIGHIRWSRGRRYVVSGALPLEPEVAGRPKPRGGN